MNGGKTTGYKKVRGNFMNFFKKILSAHLIIIIFSLICSCGPKHLIKDDVVYKDDNFNYDSLISHGAIIGGIGSKEISFSNEERVKYSSLLSNILTEHRTAVNFITTSQLMDKIGVEFYFTIMKKYDEHQRLILKDVRVIRDSIPEIGYIIMAYIKNETTSNTSYTDETENEDGKYETVNESIRALTIEFRIYDIFREKMVWNNRIYDEAKRVETSNSDSIGGTIVNDLFFGAFRRVEREAVLKEIYKKFTMDLVAIRN